MPVIFFHRTRESTEHTVLTHIGVWVKTKINKPQFVKDCMATDWHPQTNTLTKKETAQCLSLKSAGTFLDVVGSNPAQVSLSLLNPLLTTTITLLLPVNLLRFQSIPI